MAKRRIIISERDNIAALFEGDQALEFIIHRGDILLGDVYLAEVENILPSIDAAFVNVGGDKMGFLHASDLQGRGDLKTRLKPKQRLVVQVMKEPTGHKGPRVTSNISLPGRFLVLMPESRGISISRKIESAAERSRLKAVCSMIKPSGVGLIIRTEAQGQSETDVQEDFEVLLERWQNIVSMADSADPPALLYRDQDLLYRVIRETVNEDVTELVVDTSFGFQRAQQLLQNWNLDKTIKVTQYNGQQSIMVAMGVEKEIRLALQTKVPLPSGGYLYIQPTEALCVVDVNSGKFTSLQSQADTIRITNLEACKEIARQLRLRNIGGMIVVDFIDMESRADQLAILQAFEAELAPDKSKPQVGQLTDLGLVEMTRHRQGQALSEIFTKHCHHCHGTGDLLDDFRWASATAPDDPSAFDYRSRRHSPGGRNRKRDRNEQRGGNRDAQQRGNRNANDANTGGGSATANGAEEKENNRFSRRNGPAGGANAGGGRHNGGRGEGKPTAAAASTPQEEASRMMTGNNNEASEATTGLGTRQELETNKTTARPDEPQQPSRRSMDNRDDSRATSTRSQDKLPTAVGGGDASSSSPSHSGASSSPSSSKPASSAATSAALVTALTRNPASAVKKPAQPLPAGFALLWPRPLPKLNAEEAVTLPVVKSAMEEDDSTPPDLLQYYRHHAYRLGALRFAQEVKLATLPPEANQQVARANARATDVFALVLSMEAGLPLDDDAPAASSSTAVAASPVVAPSSPSPFGGSRRAPLQESGGMLAQVMQALVSSLAIQQNKPESSLPKAASGSLTKTVTADPNLISLQSDEGENPVAQDATALQNGRLETPSSLQQEAVLLPAEPPEDQDRGASQEEDSVEPAEDAPVEKATRPTRRRSPARGRSSSGRAGTRKAASPAEA